MNCQITAVFAPGVRQCLPSTLPSTEIHDLPRADESGYMVAVE